MAVIDLLTGKASAKIALRGVHVVSSLAGMSQRTTVEQTFLNMERREIEAIYTFPLPDNAAVCHFEVITGEKVLTGAIEEAEKAIDQYEKAISDGHGAFMMDQHRPDVFSVRVGNLKPRQAVTIRLTYVAKLEVVDRVIRLAFPTTVAPRYATATGMDPWKAAMDAEDLNPPHHLWVPYGLTLDVYIDLAQSVRGITSPSHALQTHQEGSSWHVTLQDGATPMDRDIIVELSLQEDTEPRVEVASREENDAFAAVTFVPVLEMDEGEPSPADVVFVLDCSGSMQGRSITQATRALELCLRSLREGDTFNICRFGSTFELMWRDSRHYSQQTLLQALEYLNRVDADMGGTEILQPLQAVLRKAAAGEAVPRDVILLTDGEVSNEPGIIDLARQRSWWNRIFAFGIGSAASSHLVRSLARVTKGAAEFISDNEPIEEKVLRTFSRLGSPQVSDVHVDWDGAQVHQAPTTCPPIFDGDAMSVWARISGSLPEKVTLHCNTPTGPRSWTVPVTRVTGADVIGSMWARQEIEQLEDKVTEGVAGGEPSSALVKQMVELSKEFTLLCSKTSFVAVEHRSLEERTSGHPEIRRVPVQLARNWHGVSATAPMALMSPGAVRQCLGQSPLPAGPPSVMFGPRIIRAHGGEPADVKARRRRSPRESDTKDLSARSGLLLILGSQQANGSFADSADLDQLVANTWADVAACRGEIEAELTRAGATAAQLEALVRDVMVLLVLAGHMSNARRQWNRAYKKAVQHIAGAMGLTAAEVQKLLAGLQARLSSMAK